MQDHIFILCDVQKAMIGSLGRYNERMYRFYKRCDWGVNDVHQPPTRVHWPRDKTGWKKSVVQSNSFVF